MHEQKTGSNRYQPFGCNYTDLFRLANNASDCTNNINITSCHYQPNKNKYGTVHFNVDGETNPHTTPNWYRNAASIVGEGIF